MINHDIAIIGGGSAGMAAAVAAYDSGVTDVCILEREEILGGILKQCIHNGFGLHKLGRELTGPEYAAVYAEKVKERGIKVYCDTMVTDIAPDKTITAQSTSGLLKIKAKAIILAMGCRERSRGALNTAGTRPAGVYSAGTAQKLMNCEGYAVGKKVVILGSGDIGLIMARRMSLEGAKVEAVCELMPYSGGLKRNIVQCLEDFGIPLYLSTTVAEIHGKDRVEGVTIAKVDENRNIIEETKRYIPCDTLLLAVGLIPENELTRNAEIAGKGAADYVLHKNIAEKTTKTGNGVRYVLPQRINADEKSDVALFLRVAQPFGKVKYTVSSGNEVLATAVRLKAAPGEMEKIVLNPEKIALANEEVIVSLEEVK